MAWEKKIYVASYKETETTSSGNEIPKFESPKEYWIDHQPASSYLEYKEYGDDIKRVRVAYGNVSQFYGVIKVKDRVYLEDDDMSEEIAEQLALSDNEYCNNANYEVVAIQPTRLKLKIDFKKIK